MATLNVSTRKIKPDIVVDNSSMSENPDTGKLEKAYNIIVHFNFEEIINRQNIKVWQYEFLSFDAPLKYNILLTELIRAKYSDDQVVALLLNFQNELEDDTKQSEHRDEYLELQRWRLKAKEIAKAAIQFAEEHDIPVVK